MKEERCENGHLIFSDEPGCPVCKPTQPDNEWQEELRKDFDSQWSPSSQHESVKQCLEKVYPFIEKEISKFLLKQKVSLKQKAIDCVPKDMKRIKNFDTSYEVENANGFNDCREQILSALKEI